VLTRAVFGDERRADKRRTRIPALRIRIDARRRAALNSPMRRIVLSVFLLLAGEAGYSAYWFILADNLKAGLGPWADAQRAHGYTVSWESVAIDGYPFLFRLRFHQAAASSSLRLPLQMTAPAVLGEARPWNLRRWRVSAPDGLSIVAPSEGAGLSAGAVDGWVVPDAEGGTAIDLIAQQLAGTGLAAGLAVANAEAQFNVPDRAPAGADALPSAALRLKNLTLPAPMPPLGDTIEALTLQGTIKGALPQGRLREVLAVWHQRGGIVEITGGSLRWGTLAIDATGTLALDDELQPVGALSTTIEGDSAIIDAVVALGKLRPGDAQLLKSVLAMVATPGPDGRQRLALPLSLRNGRLYLGPARIAAVPRITWE
jgi:hypothetical protein